MTPIDIKIELYRRQIPIIEVARRTGVSDALVHMVIQRKRNNPNIQKLIARSIGKPVREVFPKPALKAA